MFKKEINKVKRHFKNSQYFSSYELNEYLKEYEAKILNDEEDYEYFIEEISNEYFETVSTRSGNSYYVKPTKKALNLFEFEKGEEIGNDYDFYEGMRKKYGYNVFD